VRKFEGYTAVARSAFSVASEVGAVEVAGRVKGKPCEREGAVGVVLEVVNCGLRPGCSASRREFENGAAA